MSKRNAKKTKATKTEQLKIPNTGRIDAIEAVEKQAEKYRGKRDERMALQLEEAAEQSKLTQLLEKHKLEEYVYEDADGELRRAYIPAKAEAKVQKVKRAAPETDAE